MKRLAPLVLAGSQFARRILARRGKRGAGQEARLPRLPRRRQEAGRAFLQGHRRQVPERCGRRGEARRQGEEGQPGHVGPGADAAQRRRARRRRQGAGEVDPFPEVVLPPNPQIAVAPPPRGVLARSLRRTVLASRPHVQSARTNKSKGEAMRIARPTRAGRGARRVRLRAAGACSAGDRSPALRQCQHQLRAHYGRQDSTDPSVAERGQSGPRRQQRRASECAAGESSRRACSAISRSRAGSGSTKASAICRAATATRAWKGFFGNVRLGRHHRAGVLRHLRLHQPAQPRHRHVFGCAARAGRLRQVGIHEQHGLVHQPEIRPVHLRRRVFAAG